MPFFTNRTSNVCTAQSPYLVICFFIRTTIENTHRCQQDFKRSMRFCALQKRQIMCCYREKYITFSADRSLPSLFDFSFCDIFGGDSIMSLINHLYSVCYCQRGKSQAAEKWRPKRGITRLKIFLRQKKEQ